MNYKFSKKSLAHLDSVDMALRVIAKEAIKRTPIDFAVTEGYRSLARQQELYRRGRDGKGGKIVTKRDGVYLRSKHQDRMAIDIVPYINGKYDWNNVRGYRKIVEVFREVAKELKIPISIGMDWKEFVDMPHIELK